MNNKITDPYYNSQLNIYLYVDGREYEKPAKEIINFFKHQQNCLWKLNFVGVCITNDKTYIFLPKNTNEKEITREKIILLLKCLRYNLFSENETGYNCYIEMNDFYQVIDWLILDFNKNGIYKFRKKESRIQSNGKINWSKTIKKLRPTILDEQAYYDNYIKSRYNKQDDFYSFIHELIMEDISRKYGNFIWNFKFKSKNTFKHKYNLNKNKIKIKLNQKIYSSKFIRDKILFKNLLSYICHITDISNSTIIMVTQDFHVLFENSMKAYLNHINLSERIPKVEWDFYFYGQKNPVNKQIVDAFVLNKDKTVDIYDAKYYSLEKIKTKDDIVPLDWYSVGKQFFYQLSFKESFNGVFYKKGKNSFVFPIYPLPKEINDNKVWNIDDNIMRIGNITVTVMNKKQNIEILIANTFAFLNSWYLKNNK